MEVLRALLPLLITCLVVMLGLYIGLLQPKSWPTDGSKENNVSDT